MRFLFGFFLAALSVTGFAATFVFGGALTRECGAEVSQDLDACDDGLFHARHRDGDGHCVSWRVCHGSSMARHGVHRLLGRHRNRRVEGKMIKVMQADITTLDVFRLDPVRFQGWARFLDEV